MKSESTYQLYLILRGYISETLGVLPEDLKNDYCDINSILTELYKRASSNTTSASKL